MASEIKIGVIGCARILNAHLRGFKILQEKGYGDCFRISALCARKEEDAHQHGEDDNGCVAQASGQTDQDEKEEQHDDNGHGAPCWDVCSIDPLRFRSIAAKI